MVLYRFGSYELDPRNRLLLRAGDAAPLTPKAFDTLLALVRRAGRLVSKNELLDEVWKGRFVGEAVLTQNIYTLRRTLAGDGDEIDYIETVPRRGYRFRLPVEEIPRERRPIGALAVLPFEPLGIAAEGEILGLAFADALITRLTRVRRLVVRPTSAVRGFVHPDRDAVAIARSLRVDAVVSGTVQATRSQLRVTAQLVASREQPLWARTFDGSPEDLFRLQDEIAERLVDALRLELTQAEKRRLDRVEPTSTVAYQHYVRGRFFWNKRTEEDLKRAIRYFEQAIELDPRYAPAHAGLADSLVLLPLYEGISPHDAFPEAIRVAEEALAIDPGPAEAHTSLAYARFLYMWDWPSAEAGFRRALERNPSYATARHWYGFFLAAAGRHDEAVDQASRAVDLDPLSLVINSDLAFVLYFARRHAEAVDQFHRALELDPSFAYAHFGAALAYQQAGEPELAIAQGERAARLAPDNSALQAGYGYVLAANGQDGPARRILERLRAATPVKAGAVALVEAGLGLAKEALASLAAACDQRSRFAVFLDVWPVFDRLRGEAGFERLLERVGRPGARGSDRRPSRIG